jgi:hypothetical protein
MLKRVLTVDNGDILSSVVHSRVLRVHVGGVLSSHGWRSTRDERLMAKIVTQALNGV